jgi:CheY-like chemotaxis protein
MMAELDGFEFLDEMRRNDDWADIPVVVLTAKLLTDDERIFLAERAMLILSKSAQPVGTLGRALAAIAERGSVAAANPALN